MWAAVRFLGRDARAERLRHGGCGHREAWYNSSTVTRRQINQLTNFIAGAFRPERIILFGSYAYGKSHRYFRIVESRRLDGNRCDEVRMSGYEEICPGRGKNVFKAISKCRRFTFSR